MSIIASALLQVKSKSETDLFLDLLKKMHKDASRLSASELEDIAFVAAMKKGEKSGKGSLNKVKSHLSKIASGK